LPPPRREPFGPEGYGPEPPPAPLDDKARARERVQMPAILLIVVGVLNLLWALYQLGSGAYAAMLPADDLYKRNLQILKSLPPALQSLQQGMTNQSPEEFKTQSVLSNFALGGVALVGALLSIFGG